MTPEEVAHKRALLAQAKADLKRYPHGVPDSIRDEIERTEEYVVALELGGQEWEEKRPGTRRGKPRPPAKRGPIAQRGRAAAFLQQGVAGFELVQPYVRVTEGNEIWVRWDRIPDEATRRAVRSYANALTQAFHGRGKRGRPPKSSG